MKFILKFCLLGLIRRFWSHVDTGFALERIDVRAIKFTDAADFNQYDLFGSQNHRNLKFRKIALKQQNGAERIKTARLNFK